MQVGNALGVQAVGLAELRHLEVLPTALLLAAIPAGITIWLSLQRQEQPPSCASAPTQG